MELAGGMSHCCLGDYITTGFGDGEMVSTMSKEKAAPTGCGYSKTGNYANRQIESMLTTTQN